MPLFALDFPFAISGVRAPRIADGSQTGLDIAADCTFEFWYKETNAVTKALDRILVKENSTGDRAPYDIWMESNTEIRIMCAEASSGPSNTRHERSWTPSGINDNNWHHIAITFDAAAGSDSTQYELFLDGISDGNGTKENGSLISSIYNGDDNFVIGADSDSANELRGARLFDVRVWSDVRTSGEISGNYQTRIASSTANLEGNWLTGSGIERREENGDLVIDRTSNGNDLTIQPGGSANWLDYADDWPPLYSAPSEIDSDAYEVAHPAVYTSPINSGTDAFESALGGAVITNDTNAPTIENISPMAGGDLASTFDEARVTPIEFDAVDLDPGIALILLTLKYDGNDDVCIIHDGTNFIYPYNSSTSSRTVIANGFHYKILPRSGWRAAPTLTVYRVDGEGNVAL